MGLATTARGRARPGRCGEAARAASGPRRAARRGGVVARLLAPGRGRLVAHRRGPRPRAADGARLRRRVLPLRGAQGPDAPGARRLRRRDRAVVLHARADAAGPRRQARGGRQRPRRAARGRDAVLLVLRGAAVHRLRHDRRAARRDVLVPGLGADGERGRARAAVRPLRLEGRRALRGHRASRSRSSSGLVIGRLRLERWVEPWVYGVEAGEPRAGGGAPRPGPTRLGLGREAVRDIVGKVWPYVARRASRSAPASTATCRRTSWPRSWGRTPGGRCRSPC